MLYAGVIVDRPSAGYSTYLPAGTGTQIALDGVGFSYVAGTYFDSRYPCTVIDGAGRTDGPTSFVTKLKPGGDGVV